MTKPVTQTTYVKDYLFTHPCVDCGESNPIVLDFDHVRGKKLFNLACAAVENRKQDEIDLEISKCDVRCANCHRIVTHNRRLEKQKLKPYIV